MTQLVQRVTKKTSLRTEISLILFLASPLIYKQITETTELKNRKSFDWKTL